MAVINERLGSGWLALDDLPPGSLEPDTLRLRIYATTPYAPGIHIPRSIDQQVGELMATALRTGELTSLGEGIMVPHKGGIRILDPYDSRRSKLRVSVIVDIHEMVALRFITRK
jgi:hypothetical protein